jgi:hypothetical protein
MSRSASKADLIETIKSTITTDWNKQSEQGLPTDLRAYNVAALVPRPRHRRGPALRLHRERDVRARLRLRGPAAQAPEEGA